MRNNFLQLHFRRIYYPSPLHRRTTTATHRCCSHIRSYPPSPRCPRTTFLAFVAGQTCLWERRCHRTIHCWAHCPLKGTPPPCRAPRQFCSRHPRRGRLDSRTRRTEHPRCNLDSRCTLPAGRRPQNGHRHGNRTRSSSPLPLLSGRSSKRPGLCSLRSCRSRRLQRHLGCSSTRLRPCSSPALCHSSRTETPAARRYSSRLRCPGYPSHRASLAANEKT